jgi:hypothetical protein
MHDQPGVGGFIWAAFCLFVAVYLGYVVVGTLNNPTYQEGYTARYQAYQDGETARAQAREETERVQSEQWNATLRQWAWPSAAGAILIVVAAQAGRTLRHRESERTRRRALLLLYARAYLPADAQVQIIDYRGDLALVDHDAGEIVPYSVAALTVAAER